MTARSTSSWWVVTALMVACSHRNQAASGRLGADAGRRENNVSSPTVDPSTRTIDLLPVLSQGAIDAAGPIVDFGEPQAQPFVLPPLPIAFETINGDSWATVGPRVHVRVPVDTASAPTMLRVRLRRAHARAVLVVVDGIPTRQVAIPSSTGAQVVSVPLLADRFRRPTAEVELRFVGVARAAAPTTTRVGGRVNMVTETRRVVVRVHGRRRVITRTFTHPAGASNTPAVAAAADIDWIHLVHGDEAASVRTTDLVADVRANGAPRRALTLYSPTSLAAVTVVPSSARFVAAVSAEGIRGRTRAQTVVARVRVEADGVDPIERELTVDSTSPWQDLSLDLAGVGEHVARITVSAREGGDTRLAIAEPRIVARTDLPPVAPPHVRHVVMIVLRGARFDRFVPTVSPHFAAGGFARLVREGIVAPAMAASPNELAAFASAVTGLAADVHGLVEDTDVIDDAAPTYADRMRAAGVATAAFSDDAWFIGSGIDRGFTERETCANDAATCRTESMLTRATEWLANQGERRTFVLVASRAGLPPLDGPRELLTAIDPSTEEGLVTPEGTLVFAQRSRFGAITIEANTMRRIEALYDASLAGVDRGLSHLYERLRETNQLDSTAIILVGDRGVMLGESGLVGDGPMNIAAVSQTVLVARTPGGRPARMDDGVASVLDGIATAMERIETVAHDDDGATDEGPRSVFTPRAGGLHPRGVVFTASSRGDIGLAFGSLVAIPRSGSLALYQFDSDPLGQQDVGADHPIAAAFADRVLATRRAAIAAADGAGDARRTNDGGAAQSVIHRYTPSTRALPPNVAQWRRGQSR